MSESKANSFDYLWIFLPYTVFIIISFMFIGAAIIQGQYTLTEYLIERGDSFSAILTSFMIMLLFIQMRKADIDRIQTLKEIEKDRKLSHDLHTLDVRVNRIKEQLDFYAPLVARCHRFDYDSSNPRDWLNEITVQYHVLEKYELYADERTQDALRLYFSEINRDSESWISIRDKIKQVILDDFDSLKTDYQNLY
ncbi:MAG TPA: hypothetical protein VGB32_13765 [Candidatus Bathyarchaeia archaeon]